MIDHRKLCYGDLREWCAQADKLGELRRVSGANLEQDIGWASEVICKADNGPAVLFDDIPGYPHGFRVLVNVFGGRRRNMTLGFDESLTKIELSDACYESFIRNAVKIPARSVESGPIFENVFTDDAIDVTKFPAPLWHAADGGRYIGTGCYSITRDPDDGTINVGCYRAMVVDKKRITILMIEGKHGDIHKKKWHARGQPMPIVLVAGGDPAIFFAASTEAPAGVNEYEVAGGIRNQAIDLVKGRKTNLPIPANAEIAFEGFMHPGDTAPEGPFGEWTGYYAIAEEGGSSVCQVETVYHRNNPIVHGVPPIGGGADEMARYRAVLRSAMIKQNLTAAGVPDVLAVWCHEIGASRLFNVVSIRQRYSGHAVQAGHIAAQCAAGIYANRFVVVVDDDVDVTNLEQVLWTICTRCDPETSLHLLRGTRTSPADPSLSPEKRRIGDITNSRLVVDACRPFHWRNEYPKMNALSPEQSRKAHEKFGYLLSPERPLDSASTPSAADDHTRHKMTEAL